ncbi:hypothetical protein C8R43DRAFT_941723 [Mycena crocata]|nr:hypothetical protein C8R43DRAFT_941723 [Mycena crocata]
MLNSGRPLVIGHDIFSNLRRLLALHYGSSPKVRQSDINATMAAVERFAPLQGPGTTSYSNAIVQLSAIKSQLSTAKRHLSTAKAQLRASGSRAPTSMFLTGSELRDFLYGSVDCANGASAAHDRFDDVNGTDDHQARRLNNPMVLENITNPIDHQTEPSADPRVSPKEHSPSTPRPSTPTAGSHYTSSGNEQVDAVAPGVGNRHVSAAARRAPTSSPPMGGSYCSVIDLTGRIFSAHPCIFFSIHLSSFASPVDDIPFPVLFPSIPESLRMALSLCPAFK